MVAVSPKVVVHGNRREGNIYAVEIRNESNISIRNGIRRVETFGGWVRASQVHCIGPTLSTRR